MAELSERAETATATRSSGSTSRTTGAVEPPGRRLALITEILARKLSVAAAARQQGLTVAEVEESKERALEGANNALRNRPKHDEAVRVDTEPKLERKVGELVMDEFEKDCASRVQFDGSGG